MVWYTEQTFANIRECAFIRAMHNLLMCTDYIHCINICTLIVCTVYYRAYSSGGYRGGGGGGGGKGGQTRPMPPPPPLTNKDTPPAIVMNLITCHQRRTVLALAGARPVVRAKYHP